ncbi:hypothetical protein Tco_0593718 [Tanacetum coccineum]
MVQDEGTSWFQEDIETQEKNSADTKVLLEETTPNELIEDLRSGEKGKKEISTADVPVSTTGIEVSTASHDVCIAAAALVYIRRSASKAKDKGKAIMQEPEPQKKLKKREQAKAIAEQEQERINFEAVLELQRKLNEREEVPTEATQSQTIDFSDLAVLRYHALQNRPYSVAEVRKNMIMYLKNQAGYKQSYFKGMKYEEIRPIFEKVWDQTHTFVPMDSEDKEKGTEKKSGGTKSLIRKRAEEFAMEIESLATKYPIVLLEDSVLTRKLHVLSIFRANEVIKARRMKSGGWKLHENYGVHTLFMDGTPMQINMLIEKKYPLIKVLLEKMLNLQLEAEEESTMAFELLKFIKSQIEEQ